MRAYSLIPDGIRCANLYDDIYIVQCKRGYVITDGVLTDWLDQVNEAPIQYVCDGTFGTSTHIRCVISDFIAGVI